jgi:hypothetical protein
MNRVARYAVALIALAVPQAAFGNDPRYPDWPCHQIKVPELSAAAMWAGPSIDDVGEAWRNVPQISDLVARAAARRTPLEQAEKALTDYLAGFAPAEREAKAKLLFAGLFATESEERSAVMDGIERYARRQETFAEKIRSEVRQMHELQGAPNPDPAKVNELGNALNWDTRIFQERRKTISAVCEVPTLIEQRLFALARAIQQALE